MQYVLLCYNDEDRIWSWSKEEVVMSHLSVIDERLTREGKLGPSLRLLPTTFDGSHVERPEVTYVRTTCLTIDCDPPTPIQADGELFELSASHIEYTILPGGLRLIVPAISD